MFGGSLLTANLSKSVFFVLSHELKSIVFVFVQRSDWCQFHVPELALAFNGVTTPTDTVREVKRYSAVVKMMLYL